LSSLTGPRTTQSDALPFLVLYAVALMAIPSELIVRPLGAAGTPAQIIGVGLLVWWLISRVHRPPVRRRANPVKWLLLLLTIAIIASYVAGMSRPMLFTEEVNSSDRALLSLCAWAGVTLVLIDGLPTRRRLETLLKVVAGGVTGIAVLGMLQFFLHVDVAHVIQIPGLSANHQFGELIERSAYQRVSATTSHPIEFGAVLSCAIPLVIHFARFAETRKARRGWWLATAAVGLALPLSVARSGILGALIAALVLFHTWPGRLKVRMLALGGAGAVAMSFLVPGLLGTIKSLFLNAGSDPSTQGRTQDYGPAFDYVAQHVWFGRGIGTFIPSVYRTLDNQYLGFVIEAGVVGLVVFIAVFLGAGSTAGSIRRHSDDESLRDLAQSLKAGVAVLAVNAATFDALGFSMCAGMIFLLVGSIGALHSIERGDVAVAAPAQRSTAGRRWAAAGGVVLVVALAVSARGVLTAQPDYQAFGTVLIGPRQSAGDTAFGKAGRGNGITSIVHDVMASTPMREKLRDRVLSYEVAVGSGSLMMGTDVQGLAAPTLRMVSVGPSAAIADRGLSALITETSAQLRLLQQKVGLPSEDFIPLRVVQDLPAYPVSGRPSRAKLGLVLLFVLVTLACREIVVAAGGFRRRRPPVRAVSTLSPSAG
jgi:O-antigen ligase